MIYVYTVAHLAGAIAFQFTGIWEFLLIGSAITIINLWNFVKISTVVLSPLWDVELEWNVEEPLSAKCLFQLSNAITLYLMYMQGFEFFVGAAALVALPSVLTLILVAYYGIPEGEDE